MPGDDIFQTMNRLIYVYVRVLVAWRFSLFVRSSDKVFYTGCRIIIIASIYSIKNFPQIKTFFPLVRQGMFAIVCLPLNWFVPRIAAVLLLSILENQNDGKLLIYQWSVENCLKLIKHNNLLNPFDSLNVHRGDTLFEKENKVIWLKRNI